MSVVRSPSLALVHNYPHSHTHIAHIAGSRTHKQMYLWIVVEVRFGDRRFVCCVRSVPNTRVVSAPIALNSQPTTTAAANHDVRNTHSIGVSSFYTHTQRHITYVCVFVFVYTFIYIDLHLCINHRAFTIKHTTLYTRTHNTSSHPRITSRSAHQLITILRTRRFGRVVADVRVCFVSFGGSRQVFYILDCVVTIY